MYENSVEMNLIMHLYEVAKRDLYTLLVKGSTNKLDFVGETMFLGTIVQFDYRRVNRTGLDYIGLLQMCQQTITPMLKNDIRLWGKTEAVEEFYSFSPNSECLNKFKLCLTLKDESK